MIGFSASWCAFPTSLKILENKLKNIADTDATHLVVDCPGCIMQLRGGAEKNKLPLKVLHMSELLKDQMK